MKLGLFLQPAHPPERSIYDATQWNLEIIREADSLGYEEAWIGEHFTLTWEPIPSPDLLIAQALRETKRIKLAAGAHILPLHHPVELAYRVAYLDHLAQGRLMLGIGAGSVPNDQALFGIDMASGQNRRMSAEALEIMLKLWTEEGPFEYKGEFWSVNQRDYQAGGLVGPHIRPFQKPHPPIGVSGTSPKSGTLKMAGQYGFIPMSFGGCNNTIVASHWESIEEGAQLSGKTPDRQEWRVTKDVFVAETDEEAIELSVGSSMGRVHEELTIPLYRPLGILSGFKHSQDFPDDQVTAEYIIRTNGLIGSVETVTKKLDALYEEIGGFGTLLVTGYDYTEQPKVWKKSMKLLAEEVVPRLKHNRKQYFSTS